MKDMNFDDIGRRLYDEEADPPKNGWNRINATLRTDAEEKGSVFRRHWWKPLLLLLPLASYLWFKNQNGREGFQISSAGKASITSVLEGSDSLQSSSATSVQNTKPPHLGSSAPVVGTRSEVRIIHNNGNSEKSPMSVKSKATRRMSASINSNGDNAHVNTPSNITIPVEQGSNITMEPSSTGSTADAVLVMLTPSVSPDSLKSISTNPIVEDTTAFKEELAKEKQESTNEWRLTVSVAPQYYGKTASPVNNDDVLITNVKKSNGTKNLGYAIGVGVGKKISNSLYIDGEVSFIYGQQEVNYSWATGNIDTLIAIQQPDQSIRLKPVYETVQERMSFQYNYAGIRLGSTYYFNSSSRGRFNIAGSIGAYYLVHSNVWEKSEGVSVSTESGLTRATYNITVGAGYNIFFNNGWELMINPNTTYYLRAIKGADSPYNLSQRSFGVNLMISKKISFK